MPTLTKEKERFLAHFKSIFPKMALRSYNKFQYEVDSLNTIKLNHCPDGFYLLTESFNKNKNLYVTEVYIMLFYSLVKLINDGVITVGNDTVFHTFNNQGDYNIYLKHNKSQVYSTDNNIFIFKPESL